LDLPDGIETCTEVRQFAARFTENINVVQISQVEKRKDKNQGRVDAVKYIHEVIHSSW